MANRITVPSGAFRQGTDFFSLALPAIAQGLVGLTAGKKELEETTRKRAVEDLSSLIQLHGPDVVGQPQFAALYKQIFGRDWPTEDVDIPAVTETEMQKQQIGEKFEMLPEITAGMTPTEFRAARGPQAAMTQAVPIMGEVPVTREVTPARRETRPAPLGGKPAVESTLGDLGLQLPGNLARLTISQAKLLGFDLNKILFPDPQTRAQVEGQVLADFASGRQLNPRQMAIVANMISEKDPSSIEGFVVRSLAQVGGDPSKLPAWMQGYLQNTITQTDKRNTLERVREKIATKGLGSLTEGEFTLYMEEIARPSEKPPQETFADLKLQYVRDPVFRAWVDKDPDLKALIVGTGLPLQAQDLRAAQTELAQAQAASMAAAARLQAIKSSLIVQGQHAPKEWVLSKEFMKAFQDAQAAAGAVRAWEARVKALQGTAPAQAQPGQQIDALPPANSVPPGTMYRDDTTGEIWMSNGKQWQKVQP